MSIPMKVCKIPNMVMVGIFFSCSLEGFSVYFTPANKNLFSRGPLPNEKLFAGGPLANTKLFAGALSILCSPEWSYAVLFSLSLYCMVLCGHVRSFKGLSCCITELFSSDLYGCLKSCMVLFGSLWSIRSCQVLYDSK